MRPDLTQLTHAEANVVLVSVLLDFSEGYPVGLLVRHSQSLHYVSDYVPLFLGAGSAFNIK